VAGPVPAIHDFLPVRILHHARLGVIMTNRPNGILYVGVTDDLARRGWEHRVGMIEGITSRYGLKKLVFAERYDDVRTARQREQNMKHWPRAWKVRLIHGQNPDCEDLYDRLA